MRVLDSLGKWVTGGKGRIWLSSHIEQEAREVSGQRRVLHGGGAAILLGLVLLAIGVASITYGVAEVAASGCGSPPPGLSGTGCQWASPPGYFAVLGIVLVLIGLCVTVYAALTLRRKRH